MKIKKRKKVSLKTKFETFFLKIVKEKKRVRMNMCQVIFMMFLMFVTICQGVPNTRQDRINYPEPDVRNRMNEHFGTLNLFMKGGCVRGGGGWPSTTGNPSGGGRWNN